jgi:hypothetical protein
MAGVRLAAVTALALGAAALSSCGGDDSASAPKGSAENPLVAETAESTSSVIPANEASPAREKRSGASGSVNVVGGSEEPGYQALVEGQEADPRDDFTPCNLVSKARATAIVGAPIHNPLEAAQGPTCIYQSTDGKRLITVALQSVDFGELKRQLNQPRRVAVAGRTGYCGHYGQDMLHVPVPGNRVLTVGAPCPVATAFASVAVRQLSA